MFNEIFVDLEFKINIYSERHMYTCELVNRHKRQEKYDDELGCVFDSLNF